MHGCSARAEADNRMGGGLEHSVRQTRGRALGVRECVFSSSTLVQKRQPNWPFVLCGLDGKTFTTCGQRS